MLPSYHFVAKRDGLLSIKGSAPTAAFGEGKHGYNFAMGWYSIPIWSYNIANAWLS